MKELSIFIDESGDFGEVVFPLWADMLSLQYVFLDVLGKENITAVVTSSESVLKNQDGFKRVTSLVGKNISASEI